MKKILIIISSIIVLAAASIIGFVYYQIIPSKEYKTEHFSFKVPKSFKETDSPYGDGAYLFESSGGSIHIHDENINCTPNATGEFLKSYSSDKNVVLEKLVDYPYNGYFYSAERDSEDGDVLHMEYILGTDTYFLEISAFCKPSSERRVKRAISNIAKKAEYISDYRISDKPDVYDFDYVSINTGSKYICTDRTKDFEGTSNESELIIREQLAETDNISKIFYPYININVKMNSDSSPAERADSSYNSKKDSAEKHPTVIKDQQEMFGANCEHVYFEYDASLNDDEKDWISCDQYYFEKDGMSYCISASYRKGDDDADLKEMLGGITIKNK